MGEFLQQRKLLLKIQRIEILHWVETVYLSRQSSLALPRAVRLHSRHLPFHNLQTTVDHIQHTKVGDDAVDHGFACQRQGAAFNTLLSPVFGVVHDHDNAL